MHEKFINTRHGFQVLLHLNELRLENQLCDVTLKISNRPIPAHRNVLSASSPFFHAMFTGLFSESAQKDVELHELDPDVMENLIHYMYTSEIEINTDNVQNLLLTATFLQMPFVQEKCCDFLKDALEPGNCLGIKRFAGKNNCFVLQEDAERFAVGCFHKVAKEDEFLQLECNELHRMLSNPKIYHHTDDVIFSAIIRWANHDPEKRAKDINDFLAYVHPLLVSKELVKQSEIVAKTPACKEWLSKTLDSIEAEWNIFFLDKIGKTSDFYRYGLKTKKTVTLEDYPERAFAISMVGYKTSLYVQGGAADRKSIAKHYSFNIYRNNWMKLNPLLIARSHHRSCLLNDSIYSIGGNGCSGTLAEVECYDLYTGRSVEVESMYEERSSMGAVVLDNELYVMGGENENQCLLTAERYDPRIGYWETLTSMNQVNSYCSSAIIAGNIYCSEGFGNCMERYDVRMNTWELIEFKADREFYELFSIADVLHSISSTGVYQYGFAENEWSPVFEFEQTRCWDTALPLEMMIV